VLPFLVSFIVSTTITLLIVRSRWLHASRSTDRDFDKPQGFHVVPVPRIGGLGIVIGLMAGSAALAWPLGADAPRWAFLLLACAAPAFLAGFVQDFTEALTPRGRLAATALSAIAAYWVLDASIRDTSIPWLDVVVEWVAGSMVITVIAVAGIANAVNIIDGFNGLASMCVVIMLGAIAYVAYQVGDPWIGALSLAGIGAVFGFFLWNFPTGLIFLGDGGAYFLGFFVAEVSILLLQRNPGEVSPLFPLLVCIYPVFETLFSIYRRRLLRAMPPSMPDGIHLHSLIYRRVIRWAVGGASAKSLTQRNSMTSPYLWILCMGSVVPAVLFWNNTVALLAFLVLFGVSYVALYWRIVRFKSPRWMVIRPPAGRPVTPAADNRKT
jgi:UDP-N-acetylmuramyl pentapeptide phosphotransferase/UDP-N-acetylglucosamine-1-phosphate transferase